MTYTYFRSSRIVPVVKINIFTEKIIFVYVNKIFILDCVNMTSYSLFLFKKYSFHFLFKDIWYIQNKNYWKSRHINLNIISIQ